MNIKMNLILALMLLLPYTSVEAGDLKRYEIPNTQVIPIQDVKSDKQYELYVKLPESYSKNKDKIYPVIYFTDAVWHFEILSSATQFIMEDAILVGISWQKDIKEELKKNVGEYVSRFGDYTVKESNNPERQAKYQFGGADKHLDFIRNDVIKLIENTYRTDSNNRTYFGYSAGALFGAYILMAQPDTFKNYILGSPALKGNIPIISKLSSMAASKVHSNNTNVFISYGTQEKKASVHIEKFIALLKNRNEKNLSLHHSIIEGSHQTAFPLTGVRSVIWLSHLQEGNK